MVDLSIIIVSWNVADLLRACLTSIYAHPTPLELETIVVDSASSDNSVEMVCNEFPQVTLLPQRENLGYTRCNNIGLQAAHGRHLLLLNPDTEIIGDALAQLVAYLDAHADVGIVGPHTLNTDGSIQSTRRRFPTKTLAFFESTWLEGFFPQSALAWYRVSEQADSATFDVDWVQGSALMARREVYAGIGGLDEGYVMFYEEMDWCKRTKDAGWRVVYVGSAQITHHGGKSTDQVAARKHIHYNESRLRYFKKYHGALFAQVLRVFLLAGYLWQIALESFKALIGHKREIRGARVQAYWQVIRSGLKVR